MIVTEDYLEKHPNEIFVFGDNLLRYGYGGAATLRDCKNAYGFVTKKAPGNKDDAFYRPDEYLSVYLEQMTILKIEIKIHESRVLLGYPTKIWLISKLGSGLANRFKIFEKVIEPNIKKDLAEFKNIRFLWED